MCPRHALLLLLAVALALTSGGCSSAYGSGVREYDQARYPEALEDLRRAEGELARSTPERLARYALYRGLTHLALGDRSATLVWLAAAKRALDGCPTLLSVDDAGRLATAWSHLPPPAELAASP
jgi:hypothetical protein